jgi:hypothetical protein
MNWSHAFAPPQTLGHILDTLDTFPDQWLYIPVDVEEVDEETPCRACIIDSKELSPEEGESLDQYPQTIGLKCFLSITLIEDAVVNWRLQYDSFSRKELAAAVNDYWLNDAFMPADEE